MYRETDLPRLATIIAITTAFMIVLGTGIPWLYFVYMPDSAFYDVHTATVENASTSDSTATLTFSRTAQEGDNTTVIYELERVYRWQDGIDGNELYDTVYRDRVRTVADPGERAYQEQLRLPADIEPGAYRYSAVVIIDLPYGVEKEAYFSTNVFFVKMPRNTANPPGTPVSSTIAPSADMAEYIPPSAVSAANVSVDR